MQGDAQFVPVDGVLRLFHRKLVKQIFGFSILFANQYSRAKIFSHNSASGPVATPQRRNLHDWSVCKVLRTRREEQRTKRKELQPESPRNSFVMASLLCPESGFSGSFFFLPPKIPKIFCNGTLFLFGGLGGLGTADLRLSVPGCLLH